MTDWDSTMYCPAQTARGAVWNPGTRKGPTGKAWGKPCNLQAPAQGLPVESKPQRVQLLGSITNRQAHTFLPKRTLGEGTAASVLSSSSSGPHLSPGQGTLTKGRGQSVFVVRKLVSQLQ